MNRRQKIIVSITGIFIVLLALVGLTYAYFLTRITGNENDKSISVTTENLVLVYTDGNGVLTPAEMLLPGNTVKFKDKDNNIVESKTFAVTNEGDTKTDYVVVIEDVKVTNATTNATTTFESNDFRYTITCTNGTTECNGVKTEVFPMNGGIVVGNNINVGETQTYTLTMEYLETNEDQSNDMNKTLSAKINIKDIRSINPYSDNKDSLAYNIINNSMLAKNGTKLVATPPSKVAIEGSLSNWEDGIRDYTYVEIEDYIGYDYYDRETGDQKGVITSNTTCSELDSTYGSYYDEENGYWYDCNFDCVNGKLTTGYTIPERILSVTSDDYGTSYYFRGDVKDNYVNFANMCWRVVRVEGDGSIKLIAEDLDQLCNSKDTDGNLNMSGNWDYDYLDFYELFDSFKTFQTSKLSSTDLDNLKIDEWCRDNQVISTDEKGKKYYGAYTRIITNRKPSLKCSGTKLTKYNDGTDMYVGTLTADEIVYAGGTSGNGNSDYYLMNGYEWEEMEYFSWWTLSSSSEVGTYSNLFLLGKYGDLIEGDDRYYQGDYNDGHSRPAVTIKSGSVISKGNGTLEQPYVVE